MSETTYALASALLGALRSSQELIGDGTYGEPVDRIWQEDDAVHVVFVGGAEFEFSIAQRRKPTGTT